MSGLDSELESFRQQWLSDLRTRRDEPSHTAAAASSTTAAPASPTRHRRAQLDDNDDDDDSPQARVFDDEPPPQAGYTLDGAVRPPPARELVSALDHYEEAMEKEAQGNMGDSLKLYRQAYRLDNRVDRRYREKHFPPGAAAPQPPPTAASSSLARPLGTSHPPEPAAEPEPQLSIGDLIASFAALGIPPAPPPVEDAPPPPCPMAALPEELLVHILCDVAGGDPGALAAAALVCRRLAHLVATEQRVWRRAALAPGFGFPGMHYRFARGVDWGDLPPAEEERRESEDGTLLSPRELSRRRRQESVRVAAALVPGAYPSWRDMFRARPRVRFNGCYISTVNYVRSGQQSTNQATWGGAPIHIVTYYRYLRLFGDGAAISLLATAPPPDVVPHLTRDLLLLHRDREHHAHLASAPMRRALRGRWRLSPAADDAAGGARAEGDLFVETEGVDDKYTYRMDLALRSAGRAARNNKLVWRGFYSHNKLTDDWAEFGLKNDKPFYFSRVRSYGMGG